MRHHRVTTRRICIKIQMEMQLLEWKWIHSHRLHTSRFVWLIGAGLSFVWVPPMEGGAYYLITWCKSVKHQISALDMIIAQYGSQGHLLPTITAAIDIINRHERLFWMATEIRDNNFAIGSFYRSGDITTAQHIQSGNFVFVETKFTHIKKLRKSSYI